MSIRPSALRLTVLLCALLSASPVLAHPLLQNALWMVFEPERVHLAVNVSLKEILVAQQVPTDADGGLDAAALTEAPERHRDYLVAHLFVEADGVRLTGRVLQVTPPPLFTSAEQTLYQYEFEYPLGSVRPAQVTLRHEMLREFPYAAGTPWEVTYVARSRNHASHEATTALLRPGERIELATGWTPAPAVAPAPAAPPFMDYVRHGVLHILTGYDHLLFVAALVLATLSFWEMFKVVAAFTLAHTLTLALSVFDVFRLPAWIVEPVIAGSIVFVALENALWPRRAQACTRLAIAFGFGLVHGLGFAGGLLEAMADLPPRDIWIALVAFSVGVEIGHQAVVLPLFGLLALARRSLREASHPPVRRWASGVISLCGAYYLVVALHDQFRG